MKELERAFTQFVNEIYYNRFSPLKEMGEFCCDVGTGQIGFTIPQDDDIPQAEYLKEFLEEEYNFTLKNLMVFSILHEMGHYLTDYNWDDTDYAFDDIMKKFIILDGIEACEKGLFDDAYNKKLNFKYWLLPMEAKATEWAVWYYKKETDKIEKAWKKLRKSLYRQMTFKNMQTLLYFMGEKI